MKKFLLIIALLISGLGLNAQDAIIDDLEFTVTSETPAECEVSGYSGEPVNVTIPSTVTISGKEFSVTVIGNSAFQYCESLTSVDFGENSQLTSIGDFVFSGCSELTSIEIPSGVTSIGANPFTCPSLTSIVVESGNTVYDSRDNCNAIIETATNTLIAGCQNTVIPSSVTSIGSYAFQYCESLTSIEIPSGVTSIERQAFRNCYSLTSVDFGENSQLTSIGDFVFSGCSELTSIEIPSGVTSIGGGAFNGCSELTSIEIPSGVTSIGGGAFNGCSSLTSIEFEENSQLTSIEGSAFEGCSSLTSIEIPSGVTSIGGYAFDGCSSLTSIYCYAEIVPETGSYVFASCPSTMVIYVPAISVNAYKVTSPWDNYTIIALSCAVTASLNPEEAGIITGTGEYTLNDTVTLTATANEGYKFVSWTENGELVSIEKEFSFVVTTNRNFVANFEKTYEITATVNPEKVGVVMGKGAYSHGDNVTLVAIPVKTGYEFVNWTEGGEVVSEDVEYSFVATSDRELIANFVLLDYYVSAVANAAEAGEILGSGNYNHGEDVTLTAVANEGYKFVNWTEDGEVISSVEEYSFVIIKDRNLVANFIGEDIPLNVVATAIDDNTIKVEWNAVESAESYNVYRASLTRNSEYEFIANVKETSFTDTELDANTKYFYSVTAVYADGSESEKSESAEATTKPESIEELSLAFNIYPNPVSDKLYIETEVEVEEVVVYAITGVIVGQQSTVNSQQSLTIDVTNLNSGVYFVKVVTENGETVKRFIKK